MPHVALQRLCWRSGPPDVGVRDFGRCWDGEIRAGFSTWSQSLALIVIVIVVKNARMVIVVKNGQYWLIMVKQGKSYLSLTKLNDENHA